MSCNNSNNNNNCCSSTSPTQSTTSSILIREKDENVKFHDDENIFYQHGNIPVILTFPHSGELKFAGVETRKLGCNSPDWYTNDLAVSIIQAFNCIFCCCGCTSSKKDENDEKETPNQQQQCSCCNINFKSNLVEYKMECPRPYIVYSKIHREMCDFNRGEKNAFENDEMKPHYQLYHNTIKSFIQEIQTYHSEAYNGGKVVLLDMHGQSDLPDHIIRGTKNTATVQPMINQLGVDSFIGDNSIFGYLYKVGGIQVFPLNNVPSQKTDDPNNVNYVASVPINKLESVNPLDPFLEHPHYNGAFTVMHYSKEYPINCIQVEIGYTWRSTIENRIKVSRTIRSSILNYLKNYYKK